jgi:hypothetical protein
MHFGWIMLVMMLEYLACQEQHRLEKVASDTSGGLFYVYMIQMRERTKYW